MRNRDVSEFFERIEDLEAGAPEVAIVARGNRESMPSGGCGDVAVFDGIRRPALSSRRSCSAHTRATDTLNPWMRPCEPYRDCRRVHSLRGTFPKTSESSERTLLSGSRMDIR